MINIVTVQKQINVIAQYSTEPVGQENYKGIKILLILFENRWIKIFETKRIWKVKNGPYYNYYFSLYNHKKTLFTVVFQSNNQVWELINYQY